MIDDDTDGVARSQLHSLVQRIERLEEEKKALADDIRDIYAEAKANGFDPKALRTIIRMRKEDAAERAEHEAIVATYMVALGMFADTPLGEAAIERAAKPQPKPKPPGQKRKPRSRAVQAALDGLGTPVPVTGEERAKGVVAAFDKDGARMTVGMPGAAG